MTKYIQLKLNQDELKKYILNWIVDGEKEVDIDMVEKMEFSNFELLKY